MARYKVSKFTASGIESACEIYETEADAILTLDTWGYNLDDGERVAMWLIDGSDILREKWLVTAYDRESGNSATAEFDFPLKAHEAAQMGLLLDGWSVCSSVKSFFRKEVEQ